MEDPIMISTNKDVSPFESEACEKYLKSFQLNLEDIVPHTEPKEPNPESDEIQAIEASTTTNKLQNRRPTLEINGVQVKPKTLAEYREAIKRKSLDGKSSDAIVNDENKSRTKNVRRHTIESPLIADKQNVKVLGEHCNKKTAKSNSNQKVPKVKEDMGLNNENTVTRSGRVSKKVLKVENAKEKHKKHEQEEAETEPHTEPITRKVSQHCTDTDHYPNSFLRPDYKVDVEAVDCKVVMYTGAGRHLHSYAIHNYNLLTENTFDVTAWQRDFALTALNNNIDSSGRSIFRSTVPLVSKKLIQIKTDLKEGKMDSSHLIKTDSARNEKLPNRSRRRKKRKTVWTKQKTHSIPVQNAKKLKDELKDISLESEKDEDTEADISTDKEDKVETLQGTDGVTTLKRKLNPNEEDDLYWEMYGTPHKRVKLKLIQTQSDSNKKPQWTSVNYEKENRPEETEEEIGSIVSTVMDNMLNHVELNIDYNDKDITLDPTYFEEYKLENEDSSDLPKQLKRKRNNSSRVKWELKRLDVLIFEHESEGNKNGDGTCSNDFCKLGCICESISVRPKNIAINHCSEINCIFNCVCPAPRRNEHKPPIRDESEIIRSVAEKRNGRNLAKKEKEWIQTLVKTNDEYIIMQSTSGNKNKREVKKPERYREESLHWENVAHQKFLYEKVKRSLREKAKKANSDDTTQSVEEDGNENSTLDDESSTVSLKDKQRAEIKLLKRLKKKKRLQEMMKQQSEENKPTKTSPFKFYFCKEHMVLDCKCKAKKESKEEEVDNKLKDLEEEITTLTSNLSSLSSKEKDKLLSLMREQQTLTENKQEQSNARVAEGKDEVSIPGPGGDEEYIDLDTLSKFIPNPDGDKTNSANEPDRDENVKDALKNSDGTKEDSASPRLSDSVESLNQNETQSNDSHDDSMPNIQIKSVRSLQPHEFEKILSAEEEKEDDDDVRVLESTNSPSNGNIAPSQQGLAQSSLNSIQSLINQKAPFTNPKKLSIDFYGFMLHNGIGYLPISQYSPDQLYMIFKDPTKRDPLPIIFHGSDYLQKASTWANGFLNGYVKFHHKNQNPCWKIINFSTMQELRNWKLFDFKFLKDYSPMVLTDEGIYKVRGKILYKLLLLPQERVFKFKQVMEAKLDMDDISFIDKYEYFHNCRDNLPSNKPIRFIQRLQLLNENQAKDIPIPTEKSGVVMNSSEPSVSATPLDNARAPIPTTLMPTTSPNATNGHSNTTPYSPSNSGGISIRPPESLLQRPMHQKAPRPVSTVTQATHRQNIINNLNRLAMSRMKSAKASSGNIFQSATGTYFPPHVKVNSGNSSQTGGCRSGMLGNIQRPRVAHVSMPAKPPPPYPAGLNPSVVRVENLEKYKKFIQISDLLTEPMPPSKSHPILSKSLATPVLSPDHIDTAVCIEKLAAGTATKADSDIESSLDTYKITKMSSSVGEDTNNNRNNPIPRKYIQPKRNPNMSCPRTSKSPMNSSHPMTYINPLNSSHPRSSISPINSSHPRNTISPMNPSHAMTSINPMDSRTSISPMASHPLTSTSPKRAPVPGLKPIKKPLPGLKAINPGSFGCPVIPSKRLTEEVDISVSPVKNDVIDLNSSSESECMVEEVPRYRAPPTPEISIVECITRMDNKFTPITFTPNGEDTVTISPIVVNNNASHVNAGVTPYSEKMGTTVFERLSAVKRLNDGESLDVVARSMNVNSDTVAGWLRNFEKLQKRTGHRMMAGCHPFGTPES